MDHTESGPVSGAIWLLHLAIRLLSYVPWVWPILTQLHRTQFADAKQSPNHLFVFIKMSFFQDLIHCDHISSGSYFSLASHCIVRVDFCAVVMLFSDFFF